jgi:TonB family protein
MRHRIIFFGLAILVLAGASVMANAQRQANTPVDLIQRMAYPKYPYEVRAKRLTGRAVMWLNVDPRTGYVTSATLLQSTGHKILDDAALEAARQCRVQIVPDANTQTLIDAERKLKQAEEQLAADVTDTATLGAVKAAQKRVNDAKAGVRVRQVVPNRMRPWGFFSKLNDATALGTRPKILQRAWLHVAIRHHSFCFSCWKVASTAIRPNRASWQCLSFLNLATPLQPRREMLRSLSSLEARIVEAADLIAQCGRRDCR